MSFSIVYNYFKTRLCPTQLTLFIALLILPLYILGFYYIIHYPTASFVDLNSFIEAGILYIMFLFFYILIPFLGLKDTFENKLTGLFKTLIMVLFVFHSMNLIVPFIPYNSHPLIDNALAHFDESIGFYLPSFVHWVHQYPDFFKLLVGCYDQLGLFLVIMLLLVAVVGSKYRAEKVMIFAALANIIAVIMYYFWPAIGPMYVYKHLHYGPVQLQVLHEVLQMRSGVLLQHSVTADISFPSFHTIWAIMIAYGFYDRKWLFYPFCVLAGLIILSTLALAWHYLADVISGIIIAGLCIAFAECVVKYYFIDKIIKSGE